MQHCKNVNELNERIYERQPFTLTTNQNKAGISLPTRSVNQTRENGVDKTPGTVERRGNEWKLDSGICQSGQLVCCRADNALRIMALVAILPSSPLCLQIFFCIQKNIFLFQYSLLYNRLEETHTNTISSQTTITVTQF